MFSDSFVTVFFSIMGLVLVLGMIWINGFNKETRRMEKENAERNILHNKSA